MIAAIVSWFLELSKHTLPPSSNLINPYKWNDTNTASSKLLHVLISRYLEEGDFFYTFDNLIDKIAPFKKGILMAQMWRNNLLKSKAVYHKHFFNGSYVVILSLYPKYLSMLSDHPTSRLIYSDDWPWCSWIVSLVLIPFSCDVDYTLWKVRGWPHSLFTTKRITLKKEPPPKGFVFLNFVHFFSYISL